MLSQYMSDHPNGNRVPVYSDLELQGLILPRISHDLKNKIAVMTGHAQFATMAAFDAKKLSDVLATIRRIGEEASQYLDVLSHLRRALPAGSMLSSTECLREVFERVARDFAGWQTQCHLPSGVIVSVPGRWFEFLLELQLRRAAAAVGRLELSVDGPQPLNAGADVAAVSTGANGWLVLRLVYVPVPPPPEILAPSARAQIEDMVFRDMMTRLSAMVSENSRADGSLEAECRIPLSSPDEVTA